LSGISSRTFQRKLEKLGVNYTELVLEARIGIAKQWLENGDISITDISKALGYRNLTNFSRAFRGLVGHSPRAYRHCSD
jgi:AraC-like DNA-binding protein